MGVSTGQDLSIALDVITLPREIDWLYDST